MAERASRLILSRRLWPLNLAQAGAALNDNLVKNAMLVLALFQLHVGGAGLSALAGALFILPYVLLSATAGKLADRYPKPRLTVLYKLAECALMAGAAAALLSASVPALLALLFGLGCQAALFGPVKYGVLPEYLRPDELIAGNGIIEATTFCTIVLGTVAGGGLILLPGGAAIVGGTGLVLSAAGLAGAWLMPPLPAASPSLRVGINLFGETFAVLRAGRRMPAIWSSVLCLSWFWTMGATVLTELPVLARDQLHAGGSVLTLLLSVFAIGVGIGSMACARLLHNRISTRCAPWAALGISLFCWDFGGAHGEGLATAGAVLASAPGWRMLADLALLAACGGVFSVPFYAVIQDRAPPSERSRMVAVNNIMNALFMVAGAGAAAGLATAGFQAGGVLRIAAGANLLVVLRLLLRRPI